MSKSGEVLSVKIPRPQDENVNKTIGLIYVEFKRTDDAVKLSELYRVVPSTVNPSERTIRRQTLRKENWLTFPRLLHPQHRHQDQSRPVPTGITTNKSNDDEQTASWTSPSNDGRRIPSTTTTAVSSCSSSRTTTCTDGRFQRSTHGWSRTWSRQYGSSVDEETTTITIIN